MKQRRRRDLVLVGGVADANAGAAEIGAEMGVDLAQAVIEHRRIAERFG